MLAGGTLTLDNTTTINNEAGDDHASLPPPPSIVNNATIDQDGGVGAGRLAR